MDLGSGLYQSHDKTLESHESALYPVLYSARQTIEVCKGHDG